MTDVKQMTDRALAGESVKTWAAYRCLSAKERTTEAQKKTIAGLMTRAALIDAEITRRDKARMDTAHALQMSAGIFGPAV